MTARTVTERKVLDTFDGLELRGYRREVCLDALGCVVPPYSPLARLGTCWRFRRTA